ncbi:hypothetical protein KI387_026199, partial [Taxus chinensis]
MKPPLTPYAGAQILDSSLFPSLAALDPVHPWSSGGRLENVEEGFLSVEDCWAPSLLAAWVWYG